jgi:hypothetical protein
MNDMHRLAFAPMDLSVFWFHGPDTVKGENLDIPGTPGRLAMPKRHDEWSITLPFRIDGSVLYDGSAASDEYQGLLDNLRWLHQYIVGPTYTGDGTRLIKVLAPNGTNYLHGRAQIDGMDVGTKARSVWLATLDITIPAGYLTYV